jgi:hypothetical protein
MVEELQLKIRKIIYNLVIILFLKGVSYNKHFKNRLLIEFFQIDLKYQN